MREENNKDTNMETKEQFKKVFDELGVKINLLTKEAKDQYKKQTENLKDTWDTLKEKLGDVTEQGSQTWENAKEKLKNGMRELQASYDDLKEKIKK
jgi:gas vesicle protein